jgi:hypothetical protein
MKDLRTPNSEQSVSFTKFNHKNADIDDSKDESIFHGEIHPGKNQEVNLNADSLSSLKYDAKLRGNHISHLSQILSGINSNSVHVATRRTHYSNLSSELLPIRKAIKKKQKRAPNRGRIGTRGRPSKKRLDEIFGIHRECKERETKLKDVITSLEKDLQSANAQISSLEKRIQSIKFSIVEPTKTKDIIDIFNMINMEVRAPYMRSTLLLRAQTKIQAADVVDNLNSLANYASRKRAIRRLDARKLTQSDQDNRIPHESKLQFDKSCADYYVNVFGKNVFYAKSDRMVIYINNDIDFRNAILVCAFADGKMSACPKGWDQSFEMRIMLESDCNPDSGRKEHITVTLALGLLKGSKEIDYMVFFEAVKQRSGITPPFLITDFEIGIGNAAKSVWPDIVLRGCYFHYRVNLRKSVAKLKRWLCKKPKRSTINLLNVAPFLNSLPYYLDMHIGQLKLQNGKLYKSIDFKLIMYIYTIYVVRFKALFHINLRELRPRTNNTCQGQNSAISRMYAFKLSHENFLDMVECKFKHDLVRPWKYEANETSYDMLLGCLQNQSSTNARQINKFLAQSDKICTRNSKHLYTEAQKCIFGRKHKISNADDEKSNKRLSQYAISYRDFRNTKRRQKLETRKSDATTTEIENGKRQANMVNEGNIFLEFSRQTDDDSLNDCESNDSLLVDRKKIERNLSSSRKHSGKVKNLFHPKDALDKSRRRGLGESKDAINNSKRHITRISS